MRQLRDRYDNNRKSDIEFCNWVSRGLEHANLFIVEDESINNQISVVKFPLDLEMYIVEVSSKFNVGILADILYIKIFKKVKKVVLIKHEIFWKDQNIKKKLIDNQSHTYII